MSRTLDIGGDKYVSYLNLPRENNPALGWRAIRFSLERKDLFRIQLRALLRASYGYKMRLLFPMVTSAEQIIEIKEVLESVKRELRDEHIKFASNIPIGIMVEVPATVLIANKLAKMVDFFSIGTNDLIQYTLAVDRTNPLVAELFDPFHPAMLKLIQLTIEAGNKAGIKVSLCGDMANKAYSATLLLGLGIDSLSMIPRSIPKIKHLIRSLDPNQTHKLTKQCLALESGKKVLHLVEDFFNDQGLEQFILKNYLAEGGS